MNKVAQLLHDKGIRSTTIRTDVLHLLMQSSRAYTHADVERVFSNALDRVSLYRCLLTLTEAGIIQKLIDSRGHTLYFYAPPPTVAVQPHFKCSRCETVLSLPELPEVYLNAVRKYHIDTIQLLAEGTCDDCQNHRHNAITH